MKWQTPPSTSSLGTPEVDLVFQADCGDGRRFAVNLVTDLLAADYLFSALCGRRRTLLVTTTEVWSHYGARLEAMKARLQLELPVLVLAIDEASKTIESVLRICESCVEHGIGRTDALLALGGGVCMDLVTVAASLVRRGIPYIRMPTTLVGQIDAGIGIKGAVNFKGAKSYLGCFRPPENVFIDPTFLVTSTEVSLLDGIAETIKIALIGDPRLFGLVETSGANLLGARFGGDAALVRELLTRAIRGMLEQLSPNFFEDRTYRRLVDYGHTFSSLLEARSGYQITHGQAVSIDMALSASIAVTLDLLPPVDFVRIVSLLARVGLPIHSPLLTTELCEDAVSAARLHRGGSPNLVVPQGVGACGFVQDAAALTDAVLAASIARLHGPGLLC